MKIRILISLALVAFAAIWNLSGYFSEPNSQLDSGAMAEGFNTESENKLTLSKIYETGKASTTNTSVSSAKNHPKGLTRDELETVKSRLLGIWAKTSQSGFENQVIHFSNFLEKLKKERNLTVDELIVILNSSLSGKELETDLVNSIKELIAARESYAQRLSEERAMLNSLSQAERQSRIWQIRNEEFGEAFTAQLWQDELNNLKVASQLDAITDLPLSPSQMAKEWHQSISENIEDPKGYIADHSQRMYETLVHQTKIQENLKQLESVDRIQELSAIRTQLGMSKDAIERLEQLDLKREENWQKGMNYTQELDKLIQADANQNDLNELRQRYWGDYSEIIASEESSGYYRYKQTRIIGMN